MLVEKRRNKKFYLELMQHWAKRVHPSRPFCFDAENGGQPAMSNSFEGYDMEYIKKTIACLRALTHWQQRAIVLQADIDDLKGRIKADAVPPISNLSNQGRDGGFTDSQEERAAEKCEQWEAEIRRKKVELCTIKSRLGRITRAIEALENDERRIIKGRYVEGLTWGRLAQNICASVSYCRSHADKAIGDLAVMLYGPDACPGMFPADFFSKW